MKSVVLFEGALASLACHSAESSSKIKMTMQLGWKTEVLGEKPVPCLFVHHKFHMEWPGIEHGPLW